MDEKEDNKHKEELRDLRERLLKYSVGDYIGNPDPDIRDYLKAYYGDNVERLKCVKRKYDPDNVFHFEQSIPPASVDCAEAK